MKNLRLSHQGALDNIDGKNIDSVEALNGVITVVKSAGQYQVVIGNAVENVYNELIKLSGMVYSTITEADDKPKKKANIFWLYASMKSLVSLS